MRTTNFIHRSFNAGGKTVKTLLYTVMAAALMFNLSCSPEDGKDGEPGPQGEDGNANVMASDWMEIQFDETSGTPPTSGQMNIENDDIPEVDIASFVETGGTVHVYLKEDDSGSEDGGSGEYLIVPLPFDNGATHFYFALGKMTGIIEDDGLMLFIDSDFDITDFENNPALTLKYVLIPANAANRQGQGNIKNWKDVDIKNYTEVASFFGLE